MKPLDKRQLFTFGPILPEHWLCPCCDAGDINLDLLNDVWELWRQIGSHWKITSAFRCEKHNKAVGGMPNSYHLTGMAVDIQPILHTPAQLAVMAYATPHWAHHGLLLYPARGIIHYDLRPQPAALVDTPTGWLPLWPWIRERYPHLPTPNYPHQHPTPPGDP